MSGPLSVFENLSWFPYVKNVTQLREILNRSSQAKKRTAAGLCKSMQEIIQGLLELRSDEKFSDTYKGCDDKIRSLN